MIGEAREFLSAAAHGSPIWRITASIALLVCLAALYWAFGLPGSSGFAHAEDVDRKIKHEVNEAIQPVLTEQQKQATTLNEIQRTLRAQRIFELQKTILNAKKEQCTARREGRNNGYWTEQLGRLHQDYIDLTGNRPDVPTTCAEI